MTDVMVELRAANPAPADAEPHPTAWSDAALLAEIDTRSGTDMSLDQKPKTERAKAVEGPRRWSRALVTATAFVAVVLVVGAVVLLRDGGGPIPDTTVPPATTPVPTTNAPTTTDPELATPPLTSEQQQAVDAYFDAWNGDRDTFIDLFAEDATLGASNDWALRADGEYGVYERDRFFATYDWHRAVGGQVTVEPGSCQTDSDQIVCDFKYTDQFVTSTSAALDGRIRLRTRDGLVIEQELIGGTLAAGELTDAREAFRDWLDQNFPNDRRRMILTNTYPIYTDESASLWQQHVPRYFGEDAPLNAEETAFVTTFFDAWNNDIEAYLALFGPNAEIGATNQEKYGPWPSPPDSINELSWDKFDAIARWEFLIGTESVVDLDRCVARDGSIACPFQTADDLIRGTLLYVTGMLTVDVENDRIVRHVIRWTSSANGPADRFGDWLRINHADVRTVIGGESYPPRTRTPESAQLWLEYVSLWLAETGGA